MEWQQHPNANISRQFGDGKKQNGHQSYYDPQTLSKEYIQQQYKSSYRKDSGPIGDPPNLTLASQTEEKASIQVRNSSDLDGRAFSTQSSLSIQMRPSPDSLAGINMVSPSPYKSFSQPITQIVDKLPENIDLFESEECPNITVNSSVVKNCFVSQLDRKYIQMCTNFEKIQQTKKLLMNLAIEPSFLMKNNSQSARPQPKSQCQNLLPPDSNLRKNENFEKSEQNDSLEINQEPVSNTQVPDLQPDIILAEFNKCKK